MNEDIFINNLQVFYDMLNNDLGKLGFYQIIQLPNGQEQLLSISKTCCDQIGYTKNAVEANPKILVDIIAEPFKSEYLEKRKSVFSNLSSIELEIKCELDRGVVKWFQLFATTKLLVDKSIILNVIQSEITASKKNEEKLLKFNRELKLRNLVSDEIDKQINLPNLFNSVCSCLVNVGEYALAVITPMPEPNNSDQQLHPIAAFGCTDYINEIVIDLADPVQRKGPAASAMLEKKTIFVNNFHISSRTNPWHIAAEKYNIAAALVIPMTFANDKIAILTIYSSRIDAFDDHEVEILEKIANSLSIATKAIQHKEEKDKAEIELLQSKANLLTIFKNTDIGYVLLDQSYTILSFNDAVQNGYGNQIGITFKKGMNYIDLLPPERRPDKVQNFFKVITQKISLEYEVYLNSNGFEKYYNFSIHPVTDKSKVMGLAFSVQDITKRKLAELEQQKISHDLIRRNRDLEQFSYIVSHNIRAPLSNILGLKEALKITATKEENEFILEGIGQSAELLDQVVKDVNHILQVNRTILENKEHFLFADILDEIKNGLKDFIEQKNATVSGDFVLSPDIYSVKSYFVSIFHTLVLNGLKYAKPNTLAVIKIWSQYNDQNLLIHFADNGMGVDLEKYGDSFFGLYKRFHPHIQGKGLGLFLVKSQVQYLGGEIKVTSKPDVGTEFIINLPLS